MSSTTDWRLVLVSLFGIACLGTCLVRIELANEVVEWDECILRKVVIEPNSEDPCYKCSMDPELGTEVNKTGWNQKYINCSDHCDHVTVCTESHYYTIIKTDPVMIPVCYQCENRKTEAVHFLALGADKICSPTCLDCAYIHDIMTATECSRKCQGLPTFCYPTEFEFKHRKCYVATHWYGCKFEPPVNGTVLTQKCKECAAQADDEILAQECSVDCDGLPTYRRPGTTTAKTVNGSDDSAILQCVERPVAVPGEFFYYDMPSHLARYMHVSNPGNVYPVAALGIGQTWFSGNIGKFIFRKFNMSLMTWPRPAGMELIKY